MFFQQENMLIYFVAVIVLAFLVGLFVSKMIYDNSAQIQELSIENVQLERQNQLYRDTIENLLGENIAAEKKIEEHRNNIKKLDQEIDSIQHEYISILDSIQNIPDDSIIEVFIDLTGGRLGDSEGLVPIDNVREGTRRIIEGAACGAEMAKVYELLAEQHKITGKLKSINMNQHIALEHERTINKNLNQANENLRKENAILRQRQKRIERLATGSVIVAFIVGLAL